jgi:hypothetical protein
VQVDRLYVIWVSCTGRVRVRTVAVRKRGGGAVALRLGKKRLGGAFGTGL